MINPLGALSPEKAEFLPDWFERHFAPNATKNPAFVEHICREVERFLSASITVETQRISSEEVTEKMVQLLSLIHI